MSGAQKHISAAVIFAAALISVALFLRTDKPTANTQQQAVAVVTSAPERKAIPEQDQNNDGVPDWQEALQVTAPLELTGEAEENYKAPETLTEQFALEFFQDMVRAENYGVFGDSPDELVANAANSLANEVTDTLITRADIIISNENDPTTLAQYGEAIARIIISSPDTVRDNEAVILQRALRTQDPSDLKELDSKIEAYEYFLEKTLEVPVPDSVINNHLKLVNSYKAVLEDIRSMRTAFDDPMYTLLRMKRYQDDASGLFISLGNVYAELLDLGVTWDPNSPVYQVVSLNENS